MEVRRIKDWVSDDTLEHHGIKGQRWGIRRYQNEDGTLTQAGRARYGYTEKKLKSQIESDYELRKNKMSIDESAEMTLRKEGRKTERNTTLSSLGSWAGLVTTVGSAMAKKEAASTISMAAKSALITSGEVATASTVAAIAPWTLAAGATVAAASIGATAYNLYKLRKIADVSDEYSIPDSKKVRLS